MFPLTRPKVASETEEAEWYQAHRMEVGRELVEHGKWGAGGVAARARQLQEAQSAVAKKFSEPVRQRFRTEEQGWEGRVDAALLEWMEEHKAS